MHVVIADDLPPSAVDLLRSMAGWTIDARSGRKAADLASDLSQADALVVRSATTVDAALIAAAPHLRVIARAGTGVDNVDVAAATARGIVVMNAPGANSVSVAELAMGFMLALARALPAADASMKQKLWEKKRLTGIELRGRTLGLVGLGRIGQEVAARARSFGMEIVAHDPFISEEIAASLGVELLDLDALCARADFISLHLPATPATRHIIDGPRLARCRRGVRLVNTARGELIDETALAEAILAGQVAGAGLDVFEREPPTDHRLTTMPQVIASPHIAASTVEAQEQVGVETVAAVRDFLADGLIRNAVNFPSVPPEELSRLRPFMHLAERLGLLVSQISEGRTHAVGVRHYGPDVSRHTKLVASAVLTGVLRPHLSTGVTLINARDVARSRGIEVIESTSDRPRTYTNLLSVKLHTSEGERWLEGTVFEPASARLTFIDGISIEVALDGTLLVIDNDDRPGVIGAVGTILGRHAVNIGSFALGRDGQRAVGIVSVDADTSEPALAAAVDEIRQAPGIRRARLVRF